MKKIISLFLILLLSFVIASCDDNNVDNNSNDDINEKPNDSNNEANNESNNESLEPEEDLSMPTVMEKYIDKLISDTPSYIPAWNKESFKGRWNYIDGVFLNSIVSLYYTYKDTNQAKALGYKNFLIKYINYYITEEGVFINPKTGAAAYLTTELDSVCASKVLFDAFHLTNDVRYANAIQFTYENLMRMDIVNNSYNNFSHKAAYLDQIWLDGMYMYAPFYARYAIATDALEVFDVIKGQYQFIREKMFNENKKLYHHGYSSEEIFWADSSTGLSESFWLRSMGWYIVSLTDIIEYFPDSENKTYLKGLLGEALEGVLEYQDSSTKMFYQLVDKGNTTIKVPYTYLQALKNTKYMTAGNYFDTNISNYVETSGSSMIAYALMKAANLGYIDQKYLAKGKEIFEGIYNHSFSVQTNELNNICITAGLGPVGKEYRDGSAAYYLAEPVGSNDAKGVGPFIMAYLQYTNGNVDIYNRIKFNF